MTGLLCVPLFSEPFGIKYRHMKLFGINIFQHSIALAYMCLCSWILHVPISGWILEVGCFILLIIVLRTFVAPELMTIDRAKGYLKRWEKREREGFAMYIGKKMFFLFLIVAGFGIMLFSYGNKGQQQTIALLAMIYLFLVAVSAVSWKVDGRIAPYIEKRLEEMEEVQ